MSPEARGDELDARIRVLMVSTSYPSSAQDWKGIFIRNMLNKLGSDPRLDVTVWQPPGPVAPGVSEAMSESDRRWLTQLMARGGIAHELRRHPVRGMVDSFQLLYTLRTVYRRFNSVDLRHVNWLQCAMPVPDDGIPLVVSVLGTDLKLLSLPGIGARLRSVFRGRNVCICPNGAWMVPHLEKEFSGTAEVAYLPFGIDAGWYELDRGQADLNAWISVTRVTSDKIGRLFEWGASLFSDGERKLHLFGPNQDNLTIPDWVHYHGSATPDDLRTKWFPNVAGIVTLSQHSEGRPQVLMEAMAAGLPILASSLPAHSDLITHGETGWLCKNDEEFRNGVSFLSDKKNNARISRCSRRQAKKQFGTWSTYSDRLISIYKRIIS